MGLFSKAGNQAILYCVFNSKEIKKEQLEEISTILPKNSID